MTLGTPCCGAGYRERESLLRWAGLGESESGPVWSLCVRPEAVLARERDFFIDNLPVRIQFIIEIDFSRPALRHGSWNSLFQVAFYLPSCETGHPATPAHSGCFQVAV